MLTTFCTYVLQVTEFITRTFYRHYRAYALCYRTQGRVQTMQHEVQVGWHASEFEVVNALHLTATLHHAYTMRSDAD